MSYSSYLMALINLSKVEDWIGEIKMEIEIFIIEIIDKVSG